jgi:hypothetical protein
VEYHCPLDSRHCAPYRMRGTVKHIYRSHILLKCLIYKLFHYIHMDLRTRLVKKMQFFWELRMNTSKDVFSHWRLTVRCQWSGFSSDNTYYFRKQERNCFEYAKQTYYIALEFRSHIDRSRLIVLCTPRDATHELISLGGEATQLSFPFLIAVYCLPFNTVIFFGWQRQRFVSR